MRISDTHDVRVIKINHLKGLNAPIVVVVFCLSKKNQKKNLICIKIKELLT
jgi:ATP-dependent exoDNAse (exonuclease V) beta subunit